MKRTLCAAGSLLLAILTAWAVEAQAPGQGSGPGGPPAPAGGSLVVKDANGVTLGPFETSGPIVAFSTADGVVAVQLYADGSFVNSLQAYYSSSDCSGERLGNPSGSFYIQGFQKDGIVYYSRGQGTPQSVGSRSYEPIDSDSCVRQGGAFIPPDRCCYPLSYDPHSNWSPYKTFTVTSFTPPFHLAIQ